MKNTNLFFRLACFALAIFFASESLMAQRPGGGGTPGAGPSGSPIARVYGRILDNQDGSPVGYASVVLLAMRSDSILAGTMTKDNGYFALENLAMGPARLKITFLGYKENIQNIRIAGLEKDLGDFKLMPDEEILKEAVVEGQRGSVQMGIDRRIYNVEKSLTALGGTAVDALKVIPSITVDAQGEVELRGGSPRILVDGRPTDLTLEQIPAEEIERIEVITNPSVAYSAATTAGILNIVLKKNKLPGIFGMASVGVGSWDRKNAMLNLNIRQNPISFNASYNIRTGRSPVNPYNYRTNLTDGAPSGYFIQDQFSNNERTHQFGKIGLEYAINNRNTIGLSEQVMFGNMQFPNTQEFFFGDANRDTVSYGTRISDGIRKFQNLTTTLDYRRTYPTEGKEWVSFVSYSRRKNDGTTDVAIVTQDINGTPLADSPTLLNTIGGLSGSTVAFQSDFKQPVSETAKWDAGISSTWKTTDSKTDAFSRVGVGAEPQAFPLLANNYDYDEIISGAYFNYSGIWKSWGYQAGMRLEQSWFEGRIPGTDSSFTYAYPSGLDNIGNVFFPALYLSKKLDAQQEVQINASRKIRRPDFFQLLPFVLQEDNQNYRAGNPNLQPEFRNIGELNYSNTFKKGSWLTSLYGRYETNPITRVLFPANDGSGALISTAINGRAQTSIGWEQTIKYSPIKWLETTFGTNVFRLNTNADFEGQSYSNAGWNWSLRSNNEVKLPWNMTFQVNGSYEAPQILPQGKTLEQWSVDLALSKKMGQLGSITLNVNDLFDSNGRGQIINAPFYTQETWNRREPRYVQLTASFRFGKPDATLFKKQRQGGSGRSGGDDYDM